MSQFVKVYGRGVVLRDSTLESLTPSVNAPLVYHMCVCVCVCVCFLFGAFKLA
jgi:hypothetical protein